MATRLTKSEIETQLKRVTTERDNAVAGLKDFKKRVPEVMKEKIEEYSLDLCDDGVRDFCQTLGVESPRKAYQARSTVTINGFLLEGSSNSYGVDLDDGDFIDGLYNAIHSYIQDAVEVSYLSIDIETDQD